MWEGRSEEGGHWCNGLVFRLCDLRAWVPILILLLQMSYSQTQSL